MNKRYRARITGWRVLISKWWKRLVKDKGWTVTINADEFAGNRTADVWVDTRHRQASFHFSGAAEPEEEIACHEVCHVLLAPLLAASAIILEKGGVKDREMAEAVMETASETVTSTLTRLFLEMYKHGRD